MNDQEVISVIKKEKVCSIIRGVEEEKIDKVAQALIKGGIKVVEVTYNTNGASNMITYLSENYSKNFLIGAGTVLDTETAKMAIDAGAKFVLAPTLNVEVVKLCLRYNVLPVPGVATATEALTAWGNGARMIKVFPAGVLGANYIKQLKGPLSQLSIMAVGAINKDNIREMFDAGAISVGVGSEIVDKNSIMNDDFENIIEKAKSIKNQIK
ncbi:bifunctional 4-hydroxy-2-oxoglutarate aldolase/2-dehydro-3-deoxy-phosphogluconate aldolase [Tetragenococcus halophilus]|uniref:bifunctional 4-hydroxy-2-oxoglutarate aldolase/2-dehydro-3-deoxy-phosphogluconate aldolase n=1 Tax=Tetragenococcus halophilus TaxID=51669 RepID=UPI001F3CEE25|nr:bifunctional 4-hydroxy-2-oxoglutarate aldolase/2-dehydro-3-deoxy-phosphogluconate aldolase [Tetragenococcus halophilus]MCF1684745.1 bifunctional 4-hydroxy-2-oxoglutarate aldolase/2-dehydro-3-deoxy-phosphogluconate aldolase [Tetragenococcus halophilus]